MEGDRSAPVQVDLPHVAYVQSNNDYENKILIILRILILISCLSLLSWLSVRLYSDHNTFPSLSKYQFQDQTRVSEIIIDEGLTKYHDWLQEIDADLSTVMYGNSNIRTELDENNYETTEFTSQDDQQIEPDKIKSKEDQQNVIGRMASSVSLLEHHRQELEMTVAGTLALMKSLDILGKYGLDLTRDQWRCKLLENETEESRINILKFIEVSKPYRSNLIEEINCTKLSDSETDSTDQDSLNSFTYSSVIVDSEANLLLAKHLEPRVGGFIKSLIWYFDNRDSEYYKNNENDLRVLTAKILFDTDIVNCRETVDHLRTIIEQDKEYQNDYEKLLNGTRNNFVPDTRFQIILITRLNVKAAAERLYAYGIINAETLTHVLPFVNKIGRDDYVSNFGVRIHKDTNTTGENTNS